MTDLASGPEVRAPARVTKRITIRVRFILALVVAALGVLGYFTTTGSSQSATAGFVRQDAEEIYSPRSVSCHEVEAIPALTASTIFACKLSGVLFMNRPPSDSADESFTRCYVRTSGNQTVDVTRNVKMISQGDGKNPPCS